MHMQPVLLLNPFIAGQLPLILNQIQELAICQYVVPFSSVRLQVMTRNIYVCTIFASFALSALMKTNIGFGKICFPDSTLQALATTFNMTVPDIEKMMVSLIERRQVFS